MMLPARATEGKGDLNVQLRLVDVTPTAARGETPTAGIARIEVVVDAFFATHGIKLAVEKPDGTVWTARSRPFSPGALTWTDPGGEPLEPDADGPSVPARGAIKTSLAVPLEGAALHQVIVKVTGTVDGTPIGSEGAINIALGVSTYTVDDDGIANFPMGEVK